MTAGVATTERLAMLVRVRGVVQGVGFRPFVHRLAARNALDGWVRNRADGVEIMVAGAQDAIEAFVHELHAESPPLAHIAQLETTPCVAEDAGPFAIVVSTDELLERQAVAPDVAMCEGCARELYDPANRRFRYPFITCTDCGPRYSVIERMPYDRERTSMRTFTQCDACREEYETPGDRRHHSETNSCAACGPRLTLVAHRGIKRGDSCLPAAAQLLREGAILALRGLGGFHLAVDATNDEAVRRLRQAKRRDAKPFAVMVRTMNDARLVAEMSDVEAALLAARERPIVVVPRGHRWTLAPSVAPGMTTVGLMLAYTPLHHLLLDLAGVPLVMTSGNVSDEPICASEEEARSRLEQIADGYLLHDREIVARVDDSVVRVAASAPLFLRRARGFAPLPVPLPIAARAGILAVGAHLKNTVTLAADRAAYVSPHVGDLDTLETLLHFRQTIDRMADLFRIEPAIVAHDLHPGYRSTAEAMRREGVTRVAVQHHHAHIAAVCAEHGVTERVVGVAYDGTGYGDDGTAWGAEILVADLVSYERVAHLRTAPLPGSDLAVRTPWRSALGYLSLEPSLTPLFGRALEGVDSRALYVARRQTERGINAPAASSMGRLFDAAAAVLGVRHEVRFEGQAAMELEALAGTYRGELLPLPITSGSQGQLVLDPLPLLAALGERAARGMAVEALAAAFHDSVVAATVDVVRSICEHYAVGMVALGGGTFQNARLLSSVCDKLAAAGLRVLVPRLLPPNDGGISYGQAAVAAATLARSLS